MDRRSFLWAGAGALATAGMTAGPLAASGTSAFPNEARLRDAIVASERSSGGRLGVAVLDTGSSARFAYRGDERFPLCSTFKLVLVAAILSRIDRGQERSVRRIRVTPGDILGNSPFARRRVGRDASVVELSRAAIVFSDNSAANLLLPSIGGPAGLTLAAQLAAFPDIKTCIVEQKPGRLQVGQADGIACRTMEMFHAFGFSERVLKEAYWVNETSFWKPDDSNRNHIVRSG